MKLTSDQNTGFTLVENLMAMTIIVVVAIPLVALLGMASNAQSSADHRREAAHIARQIAAELAHSTVELGAPAAKWCPLIAVRPATGRPGDWPYLNQVPKNLEGHSIFLVYDDGFQPAGEIRPAEFQNGVAQPPALAPGRSPLFAIRIEFEAGVPQTSSGPARTLRATVTVGSPALGPAASRRNESFVTLIQVPDPAAGT
jgi:type II secretory pathway pseudopilin PulG